MMGTRHFLTARRPVGQPTRGKTAANRLRRVDIFALLYAPEVLRRPADALFVDVGYGAEPTTVLESGRQFRRLNPQLRVIGVEIDPARVAAARPLADEWTEFRLGGFNLPLAGHERAGLIRAFNVLRQYPAEAVAQAHTWLGEYLTPGGMLLEGTADPFGRLWVANVLRRPAAGPIRPTGLLFSTNFRAGFKPDLFQPVLPKNFIHRMVAGEPIEAFFAAWKQAYWESLPLSVWGPRRLFAATARRLAEKGYAVCTQRKFLNKGYLLWQYTH